MEVSVKVARRVVTGWVVHHRHSCVQHQRVSQTNDVLPIAEDLERSTARATRVRQSITMVCCHQSCAWESSHAPQAVTRTCAASLVVACNGSSYAERSTGSLCGGVRPQQLVKKVFCANDWSRRFPYFYGSYLLYIYIYYILLLYIIIIYTLWMCNIYYGCGIDSAPLSRGVFSRGDSAIAPFPASPAASGPRTIL